MYNVTLKYPINFISNLFSDLFFKNNLAVICEIFHLVGLDNLTFLLYFV